MERESILASMVSILRDGHLRAGTWHCDELSIAVFTLQSDGDEKTNTVVQTEGPHTLWFAGEIHDESVADTSRLMKTVRNDPDVLSGIDGEYQIALWNSAEKTLSIWNDRFGSLPLYIAQQSNRFAFAGGVRGLLAIPGFEITPDADAIREAVSFGGFRLGGRTNVAGVSMIAGATHAKWNAVTSSFTQRRYWSWADLPVSQAKPEKELIDEASFLWKRSISRRLAGATRPGQTLSGGLDSRAILAEAATAVPDWTAITYGIHGCDDARFAQMAARRAGATWIFTPMYQPGWLDLRTEFIQPTDGLIDLHDLGHLESLPLQARLLDVHLSGYIGDAVGGPTFTDVTDARGVLRKLPYYGGTLAMSEQEALARAEGMIAGLGGAAPRYALFEHKLPQSTNRWTASWRPWFRVRKPFTDYALFDFFQGIDLRLRRDANFYEKWLLAAYPSFFRDIPNQKTGVPIGSSWLRWQSARVRRVARRKLRPAVHRFGLHLEERSRGYTNDDVYWRSADARARIEETLLRSDSLTCGIFGRQRVESVVRAWFTAAAVPAQVIGALYVFETYHRDLATFIRSRLGRPPVASAAPG